MKRELVPGAAGGSRHVVPRGYDAPDAATARTAMAGHAGVQGGRPYPGECGNKEKWQAMQGCREGGLTLVSAETNNVSAHVQENTLWFQTY